MALQHQYNKFSKKIALTLQSAEYKKAREKDDLVTPKVTAAFEVAGYEIHSTFMQGSLSYNTGVIPLDGDYDIDRAVAITKSSSPDNPVDPKKIIKKVLSDHGFSDPQIKKPCVTADYKTEPMHIDYPTYRVGDYLGGYDLAVGKEHSDENNRGWEESDPIGLNEWITSRDNRQGGFFASDLTDAEKQQFNRLVRYIKRWRDFKYTSKDQRSKIYSIALTIMMNASFAPSVNEDGVADDHQALKETLSILLEDGTYFKPLGDGKYDLVVKLPVMPHCDVFKGRGADVAVVLRNRFNKLLDALHEVDDLDSLSAQCDVLRKQFGDDFPSSEEGASNQQSSRAKQSSAGLVGVSSGA